MKSRPVTVSGSCGRADLVRALAVGGTGLLAATAGLLGFSAGDDAPHDPDQPGGEEPAGGTGPGSAPVPPIVEARPPAVTPFWYPTSFEAIAPAEQDRRPPSETTSPPARPTWRGAEEALAQRLRLLSSWRDLEPRLRSALARQREGNAPDVSRIVRALGRGELPRRLPRRRQRRWGGSLQVVLDRSEHLAPFWIDQTQVYGDLVRLFGHGVVDLAVCHEGLDEPRPVRPEDGTGRYRPPPPGGAVLVLGDLGCLRGATVDDERWVRLGRRLAATGCAAVTLLPGPPARCSAGLRRLWQVLPWERDGAGGAASPEIRRQRAERLLRLVSPAVRVEPALLREVRLLLGRGESDAGTEADVWQHPAMAGTSSVAATLDPKAMSALRTAFDEELGQALAASDRPAPILEIPALLRRWRQSQALPPEIWLEEVAEFGQQARSLLPKEDIEDARAFFDWLGKSLEKDTGASPTAMRAYFSRVGARARPRANALLWTDPVIADRLMCLDWLLHHDKPNYSPPQGFTPSHARTGGPPEREHVVILRQVGDGLHASPQITAVASPDEGSQPGSPLAMIRTTNRILTVTDAQPPQTPAPAPHRNAFWKSGTPPPWAEDWGWDAYGAWVTFTVKGNPARLVTEDNMPFVTEDGKSLVVATDKPPGAVTQRMRWIPPGTFLMGSKEDDKGAFSDESPQHPVTIRRGFWLFDTACTQELFDAVMKETIRKPHRRPRHPVVGVSVNEVRAFLERINEAVPGLDLDLPTEAQWEYACRAGTTTPYSFGKTITSAQVNFGGKDIVDVATLPPNPWGLYEMHGNVWEWCADGKRAYGKEPETDPHGPLANGAARAIRGGSWLSSARFVRAACRGGYPPDGRLGDLGFRCARVQLSPTGEGGAEPADPASGAGVGTPSLLRLDQGEAAARCPLPRAPSFQVRTDCERLTFSRIARSDCAWADAIGRDRFGLWTEIAVGDVRQRMRWIPPGQFLMGSPEDELGRFVGEGPQHVVTLTKGYWLFDTPCTQALWQTVMGDNPSRFQSPNRPVEEVAWKDVQEFLNRINDQATGLDLGLPTEAQWEYACRAGTTTALYSGPIEILGANNAPALDPIAWYGGNSGVDFDLPEGDDSKNWPDKQNPHEKAGTRPVCLKRPNDWGLYDMLGNVWEWCADARRKYGSEPATDPHGDLETGAVRVIRGGSWYAHARYVRAASRFWSMSDIRNELLGFRCARVQG